MLTSSAKDGGWNRDAEEALREAIIWAAERHAAQSPMRIGVHEKLAGLKISGPMNNQERLFSVHAHHKYLRTLYLISMYNVLQEKKNGSTQSRRYFYLYLDWQC